jgi:hypothetical protein
MAFRTVSFASVRRGERINSARDVFQEQDEISSKNKGMEWHA